MCIHVCIANGYLRVFECVSFLPKHESLNSLGPPLQRPTPRSPEVWFLSWICPLVATLCNLVIAAFCLMNGVWLNMADATKVEKALKHNRAARQERATVNPQTKNPQTKNRRI